MFPRSIVPLFVGREASIKAIESAISDYGKKIFLVAQREPELEKPGPEDLFEVGTVSKILQLLRLPDGTIKVLFEGLYRARWDGTADAIIGADDAYPRVRVTRIEQESSEDDDEALVRATHEALDEYGKINKKLAQETLVAISALSDAARLADAIMPHLKVDYRRKQELLEVKFLPYYIIKQP